MPKEQFKITFDRFTDKNGDPTCCTLWGNKDETCLFLGVTGMCGQREVCRYPGAEAELERRGDDGRGTLIPSARCPLWGAEMARRAAKAPHLVHGTVHTASGRVMTTPAYPEILSCLSALERMEFDKIGYSGKNSRGEKTNISDYLNSLSHGTFEVTQTKADTGDFCESFMIARTYED